MRLDECPFCEIGQAKRMIIFRLTKDLSRASLMELMQEKPRTKNKEHTDYINLASDKFDTEDTKAMIETEAEVLIKHLRRYKNE